MTESPEAQVWAAVVTSEAKAGGGYVVAGRGGSAVNVHRRRINPALDEADALHRALF